MPEAVEPLAEEADLRGLAEAAAFFQVSEPTLRRWIQAGAPVRERGSNGVSYRLSLRDLAAWREGQRREEEEAERRRREVEGQLRLELLGGQSLAEPGEAALTPSQRAALLAEEVQRNRLAAERRRLVHFEDVALRLTEILARLRTGLRQIPDVSAGELGLTDAQRDRLADLVDDRLADTAEDLGTWARELLEAGGAGAGTGAGEGAGPEALAA